MKITNHRPDEQRNRNSVGFSASGDLTRLCAVYLLMVTIPLVPVVLLYLLFQGTNYFELQDWPKGVVASGPIAAYVFMLHYGFAHIFRTLVILAKPHPQDALRDFVGEWHCESETRLSKKLSCGDITAAMSAGQLVVSGVLNGEDANSTQFATIQSENCILDVEKNDAKILYRIKAVRSDGAVVSYECIFAGHILVGQGNSPLQLKGSWFQITGDEHASGVLTLTKAASAQLRTRCQPFS